ncbi:hypothetical protein [Vreelandella sp. EE7]
MDNLPVNEDKNKKQVILGDEGSQQAMSFKLAQAFYNEITGRSERLKEDFNSSFILTMDNIQQLHHRILQSTSQYNVATANASFSIEYLNESSERFSSIERFVAHAGSKGIAIEEVNISYNILVILPQTEKPQEYRINISLISRCAKLEKMKKDIENLPVSIPMWQFESKVTCRASIDFVDISVANAFMSVIKSWNDCLEVTEMNYALKKIRPFSNFLPAICKYGLLVVGAYYTYNALNDFFQAPSSESTAKFVLLAILLNYVLLRLGNFIGQKSEKHLDKIYQLSYIKLSGADVKLAKDSSSSFRSSVTISLGYLALTFLIGVASSVFSNVVLS